jgi:ferredoxin-NADP reductase
MVMLPDGDSRPLTIVSAPHEKVVEFLTHCPVSGSGFKHKLVSLHPGDAVEVTEAAGSFGLNDSGEKAFLVAAGVGVGAYRAIVRDRIHRKLSLHLALHYFALPGEHLFKEEWADLATKHPEFHVRYMNAGIKEAGALKFVEGEGLVPVLMSGIYTQATAEQLAAADEASFTQREEAEFAEQARKLFGG